MSLGRLLGRRRATSLSDLRSALDEMSRAQAAWREQIEAEMSRTREEIERVGRSVYRLAQSQRGLNEEIGALPRSWRRFVEEAAARPPADDPRAPVLAGLMPLKDAFLAAGRQHPDREDDWLSAFAALEARLDQTLADLGAEPLARPGARFDPRCHNAVLGYRGQVPPGTVVAVLRQGYTLAGRTVRLAEVQVSLGPEASGVEGQPAPDAHPDQPAPRPGPTPRPGEAGAARPGVDSSEEK